MMLRLKDFVANNFLLIYSTIIGNIFGILLCNLRFNGIKSNYFYFMWFFVIRKDLYDRNFENNYDFDCWICNRSNYCS